jgi:hypothetical protein
MAEVRTTSATGGQKGTKLARFDLIPQGPLWELAEHFGMGALKYANHQWRQGYEWSKSIAAKARHDSEFAAGRDYDVCSNDPDGCSYLTADGEEYHPVRPDTCYNHTGSHHMAASAWHAFVLLEFKDRFPAFDDRYKPGEDDAKYLAATSPATETDAEPFEQTDIRPFAERIDRDVAAIVAAVMAEDAGFKVAVDWRDPEPLTRSQIAERRWRAFEAYAIPARFVAGVDVVTDTAIVVDLTLLSKHKAHPYAVDFEEPQPFVEVWDVLNDETTRRTS